MKRIIKKLSLLTLILLITTMDIDVLIIKLGHLANKKRDLTKAKLNL